MAKLKIDHAFLEDIGLGDLPMEEKDLLISQVYEQLEVRVGTRLAENMSDEQLEEFDNKYIQTEDQQGAMEWLQHNFPDYPKTVEEELYKLKQELAQQADAIRQVVQEQSSQPPSSDGASPAGEGSAPDTQNM